MYTLFLLPQMWWKQNYCGKWHWCLGKHCENSSVWMGLPNSKQAKEDNKSYQRLKSVINDPLIPVKFRFFAKTAAELNKFLVFYQTEKPIVPFIGQSLEDIICSFPSTFMLAEKLKAAKTCLSLPKINLNGACCH